MSEVEASAPTSEEVPAEVAEAAPAEETPAEETHAAVAPAEEEPTAEPVPEGENEAIQSAPVRDSGRSGAHASVSNPPRVPFTESHNPLSQEGEQPTELGDNAPQPDPAVDTTNLDDGEGAPKQGFSCTSALSALVSSFDLDSSPTVSYITEVLSSITGSAVKVRARACMRPGSMRSNTDKQNWCH